MNDNEHKFRCSFDQVSTTENSGATNFLHWVTHIRCALVLEMRKITKEKNVCLKPHSTHSALVIVPDRIQ